jgi:hypothetical protein
VAILSKVGLGEVVPGVAGAPGFPLPEARAVSATCAGIRVYSVYVPNGRVPDSDHYRYKLAWLAALREAVAAGPKPAVVCGDMNIARPTRTCSTRTPTSARPTSPRRSGRCWPSWSSDGGRPLSSKRRPMTNRRGRRDQAEAGRRWRYACAGRGVDCFYPPRAGREGTAPP